MLIRPCVQLAYGLCFTESTHCLPEIYVEGRIITRPVCGKDRRV